MNTMNYSVQIINKDALDVRNLQNDRNFTE